jgi:hypothetical protein
LGEVLSLSSTSWLSSESVVISEPLKKYRTIITCYVRGTQIPGTRLPGWQNYIQWCLIFVRLQNRTCFITLFWYLEFWGGSYTSGKFVCQGHTNSGHQAAWLTKLHTVVSNICTSSK